MKLGHKGFVAVKVKHYLPSSLFHNCSPRVRAVRHGLNSSNSCWWLLKLSNMSTITREWTAMQNAECSPFVDILLTGKPRSGVVRGSQGG